MLVSSTIHLFVHISFTWSINRNINLSLIFEKNKNTHSIFISYLFFHTGVSPHVPAYLWFTHIQLLKCRYWSRSKDQRIQSSLKMKKCEAEQLWLLLCANSLHSYNRQNIMRDVHIKQHTHHRKIKYEINWVRIWSSEF